MLASDEDGSTLNALKFSLASEIVELVVLTGDELFLRIMREAVGSTRRLWHVPSADKVSDLLVAGEVGIVVLDVAALTEPPQTFVSQIKLQFPDLVVVVAGSRDTEILLAREISSGVVYRFIHKPLSPNRAKLFVEAAVRRYDEHRQTVVTVPVEPKSKLPWVAGTLIVIAALAGAVFFSLRGTSNTDNSLVSVERSRAESPLLTRAQAALAANRLTAPEGDNALQLYQQILARTPADEKARLGLAEVRERLLAKAENTLLEERLDEAASNIEVASNAGVEPGRIAFLTAQLAKAREQLKSAQAAQRARGVPKPALADAASPADTSTAAVEDKAAPLVNLAAARMNEGHLVDPERDNARFYVLEALRTSPGSEAALDVKRQLALKILSDARAAMDRRDFARANDMIIAADNIASQSNIDTAVALLNASRQQAQSDSYAQLLKNAQERLQQDRLIEPANDNAKYYYTTLKSVDPGNAGIAPLQQELGARLVGKARLALTLQQYDAAKSWLDEAAGLGYASADGNSARHELEVAAAKQKFLSNIIPASALTVMKSVQPTYPSKALSGRIEGWVEVDFTVSEQGQVTDLTLRAASPSGVFEEAAMKAVAQWRYAPVLRDGKPVPVRSSMRIRFNLPSS